MDVGVPAAREYVATPGAGGSVPVREEVLQLPAGDALQAEIAAFLQAVATGSAPPVSGADGLRSMELADRVMRDIARNVLP
jgi:predicted dehydrogenase